MLGVFPGTAAAGAVVGVVVIGGCGGGRGDGRIGGGGDNFNVGDGENIVVFGGAGGGGKVRGFFGIGDFGFASSFAFVFGHSEKVGISFITFCRGFAEVFVGEGLGID